MKLTMEANGYRLEKSLNNVDYYVKVIEQPDELPYNRIISFEKESDEIIISEGNNNWLPRLSFEEVCAIQQQMVENLVKRGE
jgi:hypothetical protein